MSWDFFSEPWYLSHEPEESFTPAAQEVETLAETWDDKLDSGIPEASIKEESLYTGEVSDNTQTVISEDENGSNVDLSGSVTKEEAQETQTYRETGAHWGYHK